MTRSTETLTRAHIAAAIQRELGISHANSLEVVESTLRLMCSALARGENVKISGFGTFLLRDKSDRIGRNPKTLEEHTIPPRRVLTFRASAGLRERICPASKAKAPRTKARELATQG